MAEYKILKVKSDCLEEMGSYEASNAQQAINKMAKKGYLSGREWDMRYYAIPKAYFLKTYKPNVK